MKDKERVKKVRKKLLKFLAFLLVVLMLLILFMINFVNPIIKETGESKIKESNNYVVNDAIASAMRGTVTYDDLVSIVTDSSGKIVMLQANSIQINVLSRKVIEQAYSLLIERLKAPLSIPLGSFSGLPILSGVGPRVKIDVLPYGSVGCMFLSKFESAGINQTVHKIYLEVTSSITIVLPYNKVSVDNVSEVLICESLIIGEIPHTYLMAEEKGDLLNMAG